MEQSGCTIMQVKVALLSFNEYTFVCGNVCSIFCAMLRGWFRWMVLVSCSTHCQAVRLAMACGNRLAHIINMFLERVRLATHTNKQISMAASKMYDSFSRCDWCGVTGRADLLNVLTAIYCYCSGSDFKVCESRKLKIQGNSLSPSLSSRRIPFYPLEIMRINY